MLSVAALPALLLHGALLGSLPAIQPVISRPAPPATVRVRAVEAVAPRLAAGRLDAAVEVLPGAAEPAQLQPMADARTPLPMAMESLGTGANVSSATVPAEMIDAELPEQPTAAVVRQIGSASADEPEAASFAGRPERPGEALAEAVDQLQLLARNDSNVAVDRPRSVAEADGVAVPSYSTAPAASQVLRYKLQRGLLSGTGELSWRRDPVNLPGAKYELQLVAKVGGISIMTQISSGGFDNSGLAPVRFTDQRLRGSVRATNFQRKRGVISFSGPSVEFALVNGAQDRLSWMLQLPAIIAANPQLAQPGQEVTLYVVGARGDASIWVFRCEATESITTDAGAINAVKFIREPRKDHDTLAEVWLDPARNYLPARARIGNPDDGAMLELLRVQD